MERKAYDCDVCGSADVKSVLLMTKGRTETHVCESCVSKHFSVDILAKLKKPRPTTF